MPLFFKYFSIPVEFMGINLYIAWAGGEAATIVFKVDFKYEKQISN